MGRIAIVAMLLLPCAAEAAEVRRDLHLSWNELHAVVPGHVARVRLRDGGSVLGRIHSVETEGLRMGVSFATDEKRFPSKRLLIPSSEVTEIRIEKRQKRWRAILTAGVPAVLVLGVATAVNRTHPTPTGREIVGAGAAAAAGGAIGGYLVGWRLDRREVLVITLVPPPVP